MEPNLASFTDILSDEIPDSQPLSLSSNNTISQRSQKYTSELTKESNRPKKHTGQHGEFRSVEEIDPKYRGVFAYPFFNLVQSRVIEDALYSDKSMVVCAPTGSGKTVVFEMAIVQLLMEIDEKKYDKDFKIIYMAPVKALCTERLTEWYSKFTRLGLLCIEVTGDTDVDVSHLKPYRVIITTPEKWDMLTRRWRDHRGLVELIKLFLIDEVHILNDETRGPVLEAVVSRMKTIESSTQSEYRIEQLQRQYQSSQSTNPPVLEDMPPPRIRFVAVSATVSNPEDVASWLGNSDKPAVYYKFGDECRPVKLKRVVEGYPCTEGTSIFKFDIILNYKLWPIIQKYHNGKPTLIFCNTRKSVTLTAEALSREITISFNPEQRARLTALASTIKNKKLQSLVLAGVGCHHAGLLYEERVNIENAFRNRDLPILITTTTLAMGVNLPAHLVIIKNTQQYVNGAYQEYSISTVLQMVGRAGRPQFDTEATAVIMTRMSDKPRYEALVCGSEPLQSYLHKRLPENLNSEAALGTVKDVAQCVQWLRSTFLYVRAARDPKRYLGLPNNAPNHLISKKIEELCVRAMNGLATAGLISMDEASCIESTEAGRLMSIFYLDLETMKHIMKIEGSATLEQVLWVICESHELADMHLRVDERRCLNALNRNNVAPTIRFPMKGKISTRQMKLNCVIQAVLGCLPIPDASLNQEATKVMRTADRICKCLVAYVTRPDLVSGQPKFFSAVYNSLILAKCISAHIWENSPYVSKQLKGIGPTFSTLLATAGKINFMLLEESHPRDLERIMNKCPPAGNVLRKQISLLPKYQITMTPVDEKVVTMQLSLLNHNYLAENIENLTAGERHKSYIVVGDSENYLLLLKSFQDKDLIGMYDGIIIHEVKRKHNFEHKIIVHCVSSLFVGIDAQCEYVFKDLDPAPMHNDVNSIYFNTDSPGNKTRQKQTCITDIYKQRKRKSNCDSEIAQSKEKKKRESALAENIRLLKDSFGRTSKMAKDELQKTAEMSNKVVHEILSVDKNVSLENSKKSPPQSTIYEKTTDKTEFTESNMSKSLEDVNFDGFGIDEYIGDTKINDILKHIESEISNDAGNVKGSGIPSKNKNNEHTRHRFEYLKDEKLANVKKRTKRSNLNILDLQDKNFDFNEEEDKKSMNDTGFSNTSISHINSYLQQTKLSSKRPDILVEMLIEKNDNDIYNRTDKNNTNLPLLDLSMEDNETIKKTMQRETEIEVNLIDLTEVEDADIVIEAKVDAKATQSSISSNASLVPLYSHKTKTEKGGLRNITTNDSDNIDPSQNQQSPCCLLKDTVNNDYSVVPFGSQGNSEIFVTNNINNIDFYQDPKRSHTYMLQEIFNNHNRQPLNSLKNTENNNEYDVGRQLVSNGFYSDFDAVHNKILNLEQKTRKDNPLTTEAVNDKVNMRYNINKTDDLNPKRNHIRNFSYSATNVDIFTRHLADHHVHVIKKIKVDLDVTEIVTHDNLKQDTNSVFSCNENACTFVPPIKTIERSDFTDLSQDSVVSINQNGSSNSSIIKGKLNNELPNKEDNNDCHNNYLSLKPHKIITKTHVFKPMESISEQKYGKNVSKGNNTKAQSILTITDKESLKVIAAETKDNPDAQVRSKISLEGKLAPNSIFTKFSCRPNATKVKTCEAVIEVVDENCTDAQYTGTQKVEELDNIIIHEISETNIPKSDIQTITLNRKENKLEDILKKYCQAFRQIKKEDEKLLTKLPQVNNQPQIKSQKNKRPFKITDIDKLEPKLPPMLIAETPVHTILPQHQEVIEEQNKISPFQTDTTPEVTDIGRKEVISEEEMELITPIPLQSHINSDYKIDDSMLNPKTLLQCLIIDEPEIVPPPPEFSDLNYSPSQPVENEDYNYESMTNSSPDNYENISNSPNHNYVDFEHKTILNTSNKGEILLLSNNNITETRPWAITQPSALRDVSGTCDSTRPTKLNYFKFINKKKFKIKHQHGKYN